MCCATQVSRLEQRIHAVTADNEALQAELDGARRDANRARDTAASTSAGEGLARLPRDQWPLPVLMLVQAAEAAAVTDIAEKHVSAVLAGAAWSRPCMSGLSGSLLREALRRNVCWSLHTGLQHVTYSRVPCTN